MLIIVIINYYYYLFHLLCSIIYFHSVMFLFNVLTGMKGREERAKQFVETSGSAIMTEEDILEDDLLYDRVRTNDVKKGNCPACHFAVTHMTFVTQRELMRLFERDIKTDILNSTYCSISKEHFDTKMIFISYSYQKL